MLHIPPDDRLILESNKSNTHAMPAEVGRGLFQVQNNFAPNPATMRPRNNCGGEETRVPGMQPILAKDPSGFNLPDQESKKQQIAFQTSDKGPTSAPTLLL